MGFDNRDGVVIISIKQKRASFTVVIKDPSTDKKTRVTMLYICVNVPASGTDHVKDSHKGGCLSRAYGPDRDGWCVGQAHYPLLSGLC
ncbi:MAG: hypothetical protein UV51_C0012G0007 [Candidatus Woesebacteria bacterium GW2011_GWC1_42_9]|nr:MAG: hypothetical protein UV51_C0012G0007 [Candidatus Woesebacteria bacterium GW2011_GWC1_42_9]